MPLNLDPVLSGYNLSVINDNFQKIDSVWDEKLDRLVSTQSNQMEQELDLNSNKLINVGKGVADSDGINVGQTKELLSSSGVSGGSVIAETPPPIAVNGQRWTRCSDMVSFIWYEDIYGGQWVEDNPSMGAVAPANLDWTEHVAQNASFNYVKAGTGPIGSNVRDAFLVSRTLPSLTDCHAFADKTVISNPTDSGTYGTFDATTEVAGAHTQSHLFAFQDRTKFSGSGQLSTWGNIIWPEHVGSGHVVTRQNLEIKDVTLTGGGTVATNIGLLVNNLSKANSNSAITLLQDNGFAIYSPNAGDVQFGGKLRVDGTVTHKGTSLFEGTNYLGGNTKIGGYTNGTPPIIGAAATIEKDGLSIQGFVDVNSLGFSAGVLGDNKIQLVSDAMSRITIGNSTESYDLFPAAGGTQKLGRPNNPFKSVVLKDTANGNSYKLEVTNGVLAVSLA
jgi:hypothetical protein